MKESGKLGLEANPNDWHPDWCAWIGLQPGRLGQLGVWVFVADGRPGSHESFLTPFFDTPESAAPIVDHYVSLVTGIHLTFQPPKSAIDRLDEIRVAYAGRP